jgi:competence protein ComEA
MKGSTAYLLLALCAAMLSRSAPAFAQSRARDRSAVAAGGAPQPVQSPTAARGTSAGVAPAVRDAAPDGVVNINSATEEELTRLPRIGPSRATAIVALRSRVQRFRSTDDLLRVRGIGRASLRALRPFVALTGETTLLARPGRRAAQRVVTAP